MLTFILLSFCPYYLKNVILFLDEPSGIAESYVFNLVLCLSFVLLSLLSKNDPAWNLVLKTAGH